MIFINFITEDNRIFALDDSGKPIAEITFPQIAPGIVNINHTFVDESLRGQGVADALVRAAIEKIRRSDMRAVASCSYAKSWFKKHKEHSDLLVEN